MKSLAVDASVIVDAQEQSIPPKILVMLAVLGIIFAAVLVLSVFLYTMWGRPLIKAGMFKRLPNLLKNKEFDAVAESEAAIADFPNRRLRRLTLYETKLALELNSLRHERAIAQVQYFRDGSMDASQLWRELRDIRAMTVGNTND